MQDYTNVLKDHVAVAGVVFSVQYSPGSCSLKSKHWHPHGKHNSMLRVRAIPDLILVPSSNKTHDVVLSLL